MAKIPPMQRDYLGMGPGDRITFLTSATGRGIADLEVEVTSLAVVDVARRYVVRVKSGNRHSAHVVKHTVGSSITPADANASVHRLVDDAIANIAAQIA